MVRCANVSQGVQGSPTGVRATLYIMHMRVLALRTRGQRDPLQLAEHSGDAAGIVPAIADVPGRATLHHL